VLTSDKNESISVSEYGIEVENDSSKQSIGFADIKDVEIVDGNVLQIKTESVLLKYQLVGMENNQAFINDFGIKKLKAERTAKAVEQTNANNSGNINQITVNVPSNESTEFSKFAALAGRKAVSKTVYCLLAIFLGGLGIHKFYGGKIVAGVIYIVFCWTLIPSLVGFIEGLMALGKPTDSQGQIYI